MALKGGVLSDIYKSVRLSMDQVRAILDRLDGSNTGPERERRANERFSYRTLAIVHLQEPREVAYLVPTRNLSKGGLAILHGGFLHNGTRCMVSLITTQGAWNKGPSQVVRCRYLEAGIHEISLRFDNEIDVTAYCAGSIRRRVLLAEDDPMAARLAEFYLDRLNTDHDHAQDGGSAFDMAMENAYDLILMDMEMPVMDGFEVAQKLRENGYVGTVAAATALTQPGDRERCLAAGCDYYLRKPYTEKDLTDLLELVGKEPLYSSLAGDAAMAPLIDAFIASLSARVREVEEAVSANEAQQLQTLLRRLKGEGGSFGFEVISDKAAQIEAALVTGTQIEPLRKEVDGLIRLCLQARSSARTL